MGALDGRGAVVAGGAAGIGRGIARAFAAGGAQALRAGIDGARAGATARGSAPDVGTECAAVPTDVTDQGAVNAMVDSAVETFGRLDVLVNNAWKPSGYAHVEDISDEQKRAGYEMAVMAAFWSMKRA